MVYFLKRQAIHGKIVQNRHGLGYVSGMSKLFYALTLAAGVYPLPAHGGLSDGPDPNVVQIYDNDVPVLVNGAKQKDPTKVGKSSASGYSISANFNFMTVVCANPSNALTSNALIRSYFHEGDLKGIVADYTKPESWHKVSTYLEKNHDYAVAPDGSVISLDTSEKYEAFLAFVQDGQWDNAGYPREKTQDFANLVSLQCGAGY